LREKLANDRVEVKAYFIIEALAGTQPALCWRDAWDPEAQYKVILHCREALRHAQGRELYRTAPACLSRPDQFSIEKETHP
jgi:hypothetical protein